MAALRIGQPNFWGKLLGPHKERLFLSGIGTERLVFCFYPGE